MADGQKVQRTLERPRRIRIQCHADRQSAHGALGPSAIRDPPSASSFYPFNNCYRANPPAFGKTLMRSYGNATGRLRV